MDLVPAKDEKGLDYVPIYAEEADEAMIALILLSLPASRSSTDAHHRRQSG